MMHCVTSAAATSHVHRRGLAATRSGSTVAVAANAPGNMLVPSSLSQMSSKEVSLLRKPCTTPLSISHGSTPRGPARGLTSVLPHRRAILSPASAVAGSDQSAPTGVPFRTSNDGTSGNGNGPRNIVHPEAGADAGQRAPGAIWPRGSVAAAILGGGEMDSRRLFPLTGHRTLPAIPFGGCYRIIDVVLSNLIHSGINKIHVLTAFNSYSLNHHLQQAYDLNSGVPYGGDGYLEVVSNWQSPEGQRWSSGTADSVRQFMSYFDSNTKNRSIEDILVLPGDQVYRADFTPIITFHRQQNADLTIVCRPVTSEQAEHLGVVKMQRGSLRITGFKEKPRGLELTQMSMDPGELAPFLEQAAGQDMTAGTNAHPYLTVSTDNDPMEGAGSESGFVGSTGIYVFKRHVLSSALQTYYKSHDFGRQLLPELIQAGCKVVAYRLPGYWEDIGGCIADFHAANLKLLRDDLPHLSLATVNHQPVFKFPFARLPSSQLVNVKSRGALISTGCTLRDCTIINSIVGVCNIIGPGVVVSDSVLMGADHYEEEKPPHLRKKTSALYPPIGIGEGTVIQKAVVDLNCRIGKNVSLVNKEGVYESFDRAQRGVYIRDGIIVLARGTVLPDGFKM